MHEKPDNTYVVILQTLLAVISASILLVGGFSRMATIALNCQM
jgi:hypothetical protein